MCIHVYVYYVHSWYPKWGLVVLAFEHEMQCKLFPFYFQQEECNSTIICTTMNSKNVKFWKAFP